MVYIISDNGTVILCINIIYTLLKYLNVDFFVHITLPPLCCLVIASMKRCVRYKLLK